MELLYIWIKEYNNIENQGFNFNPNFCFDIEEDLRKYKIINKSEECGEYNQEGFFGKNISNITGIIGKNGSGKSNLLWFIFRKILSTKERYNYATSIKSDFIIILKKSNSSKEEILVYSTEGFTVNEDNSKYSFFKYNKTLQDRFKNTNTDRNKFIYFNTLFFTPIFKSQNDWKDNTNNLSLYKAYEENKTQAEIRGNNMKFISFYLKKNITRDEIKIPKTVKIIPRPDRNADLSSNNQSEIERRISENFYRILKKYYWPSKFMNINKDNIFNNCYSIENFIDKTQNIIDFYEGNPNILGYKLEYDMRNIYLEKMSFYNKPERNDEKLYNYAKNMNTILAKHLDKIGGEFSLEDNTIIDFIELYNYTVISTRDEKSERMLLNDWLEFQYLPELSSGEEHMISLYGALYNYFKDTIKGNYVILLDEPDIFMHPEWQRKMINSLCIFFNEVLSLDEETKIHLVISSHSPFIASDLPKENIIMLDKSEDNKCRVKEEKIDTFGANIFSLYKEAFFVESSFGEFAKDKIQKITLELSDKDNKIPLERKQEIWETIQMIGENLVRKKLENMYYEFFEIKEEKRELEKLIEEKGLSKNDIEKIIEQIKGI